MDVNGTDESPVLRAPLVTGLVLLIARGLLLWVVIPLMVVSWVLGRPYWRGKGASLGQLLGWADLNLIASLQRGPLRPLVTNPVAWRTVREVSNTTHRLRAVDPA